MSMNTRNWILVKLLLRSNLLENRDSYNLIRTFLHLNSFSNKEMKSLMKKDNMIFNTISLYDFNNKLIHDKYQINLYYNPYEYYINLFYIRPMIPLTPFIKIELKPFEECVFMMGE